MFSSRKACLAHRASQKCVHTRVLHVHEALLLHKKLPHLEDFTHKHQHMFLPTELVQHYDIMHIRAHLCTLKFLCKTFAPRSFTERNFFPQTRRGKVRKLKLTAVAWEKRLRCVIPILSQRLMVHICPAAKQNI